MGQTPDRDSFENPLNSSSSSSSSDSNLKQRQNSGKSNNRGSGSESFKKKLSKKIISKFLPSKPPKSPRVHDHDNDKNIISKSSKKGHETRGKGKGGKKGKKGKRRLRFSITIEEGKVKQVIGVDGDGKNLEEDEYVRCKVIGIGNYGKVFLVQKKSNNEYYAMKIMKKKYVVESNSIQQINMEKFLLAGVCHPFIIQLHAAFQSGTKLYLVMDYLNGGDIFFHLEKEKRFTEEKTKFYIAELLLALIYLHESNIIHRDLKLENLLLGDDGHLALTDFGFSKILTCDSDKTNTFCGTPDYLAPEMILIQGEGYSNSVDYWALGILMYEMLIGRTPFEDENHHNVMKKVLTKKVTFPSKIPVSSEAKELVMKLLDKNPETRIGTQSSEEVKNHPWFKDIDFVKLYQKKIPPPFIPDVKNKYDTKYIDRCVLRENIHSARMNIRFDEGMIKQFSEQFEGYDFKK